MVTREIPLTQGFVTLVDDEDYDAVMAMGKWHVNLSRSVRYARTSVRPPDGGRPWRALALHTFLTGWPRVDHINGDGLDNRRSNLRPATHAQNMANKRRYKNNATGYKGVVRNHKPGKPWVARIRVSGQGFHLGQFSTAEEAARAYDTAAIAAWGEFARPNFPLGGAA